MRNALIALWMLLGFATPALAQLSINFEVPGASIGINLPAYPQLQRVPGYPVYYAPGMNSNYFFYDGLYWVFQGDNWYASSWYNGPWGLVDPMDVPLFVLRVPVRYYRSAPVYFHGWSANDSPRWGDHWGQSWEKRRSGWDQWNHNSAPAPAPLPTYQRQYSGNRYPQASQQATIQNQNYRYQPKEPVAQQHFQQTRAQSPAAQPQQAAPQQQAPRQQQQSPRPQQQQQQAQQPAQPHVAQPQQAEHKPQQAPVAREQQAAKQPQPQPQPQAQPKPKPQPKPQPQQTQQPQQAAQSQHPEHKPQQAQAPHPQSQEKAPQGKEQPKPQGKAQPKEQPKEQDKEQGKEKDNAR
ncbi:MAG: hypothetical protein WA190_15810 [Usitatibacter sp.]